MESTSREPAKTHPARAAHRRAWAATTLAVLLTVSLVSIPRRAETCPGWLPFCWLDDIAEGIWGVLRDVREVIYDFVTLQPQEAFPDALSVVLDLFCIADDTALQGAISDTAENIDVSCGGGVLVDPAIQAQLENYFFIPGDSDDVSDRQPHDFSSVVLIGDCEDIGSVARTYGERIYFAPGELNLFCDQPGEQPCLGGIFVPGFALLAHELVHVLQYRRMGREDFMCEYADDCGLDPYIGGGVVACDCDLEQAAYRVQAMVFDDMRRDGDGIFSCPLDENEC